MKVNGDPSLIWLFVALLVFGLVATVWFFWDKYRKRNQPQPPRPSERQNPPLPPLRRRPNDGGNQELYGAGPDAASNDTGD